MTDTIICRIQKNRREELRVFLTSYQGHSLCGLRVLYRPEGGGDFRPGKSGINFRVHQLPDIIEGLQAALLEAKACGLFRSTTEPAE